MVQMTGKLLLTLPKALLECPPSGPLVHTGLPPTRPARTRTGRLSSRGSPDRGGSRGSYESVGLQLPARARRLKRKPAHGQTGAAAWGGFGEGPGPETPA